VPNEGDGWDHVQVQLRTYFEHCRGNGSATEDWLPDADVSRLAATRRDPPCSLVDSAGPSLESARLLGRRTAEFHVALSHERRDAAFTPVPMSTEYLRGLADDFSRRAQETLELLNARIQLLPAGVSASVHEVLSRGSVLTRRFEALEGMRSRATRQRCHGDYHLGQVLRTSDDFILLDFEGEPLHSLEQRRKKVSPLKDVAGMLRSFSYAVHSAWREAVAGDPGLSAKREPWLRAWEVWTSAAFLGAYLETAGAAAFLPQEEQELETLLDAFLLDKAFYELGYELNNRPDWLPIPLEGIREIAGRNDDEPAGQ
jgi:trehalose synthase-fused probable maltokinase